MSGDVKTKVAGGERMPEENQTAESPLLLVKVYQDSMAVLFRIDAELSGADKVQEQHLTELATVESELNTLAQREMTFQTLKRAVATAEANAELYGRRMIEEEISLDSRAAKILSVKVIQRAGTSLAPIFPNYKAVAAVSIVLSFALAFGIAAYFGLDQARNRHGLG